MQKTLLDLIGKAEKGALKAFDRIVIETTGLADPAPIIHTLMTSHALRGICELDTVVTVVDAVNGSDTLDKHKEAMKQAAMADYIILSKTDIAEEGVQGTITKRLKAINPSAALILSSEHEELASALTDSAAYNPNSKTGNVAEWLAEGRSHDDGHDHSHEHHHDHSHGHEHHHHHDVNRHSDTIHAFCMTHDAPIHRLALGIFIEAIAVNLGPSLLRVKGIIDVAGEDKPAVIHGVQHIFHPLQWLEAWPDEDKRTKLVFITDGISQDKIEGLFKIILEKVEENPALNEKAQG